MIKAPSSALSEKNEWYVTFRTTLTISLAWPVIVTQWAIISVPTTRRERQSITKPARSMQDRGFEMTSVHAI